MPSSYRTSPHHKKYHLENAISVVKDNPSNGINLPVRPSLKFLPSPTCMDRLHTQILLLIGLKLVLIIVLGCAVRISIIYNHCHIASPERNHQAMANDLGLTALPRPRAVRVRAWTHKTKSGCFTCKWVAATLFKYPIHSN